MDADRPKPSAGEGPALPVRTDVTTPNRRHRRRRRQPGRVHPPIRTSGRAPRSAGLGADRRPVAVAGAHGITDEDLEAPAGLARRRPRSPSPRRTPTRRSRSCGASTARRPASTSRTSSCPRSATGCAHAAESGRFLPPMDPASAERCSIASRRSKCSSGSCTARSPARRASRSKASTCWCRSSTRSSPARPTAARATRSSAWRIAAG